MSTHYTLYDPVTGVIKGNGTVADPAAVALQAALYPSDAVAAVYSDPDDHYIVVIPGGAGIPWQPDALPSTKNWFRADDLSAGAVATWPDAISAKDATQSTSGNRPTAVAGVLDGKPVVRFNPSNSSRMMLPADIFADFAQGSVFVVTKKPTDPAGSGATGPLLGRCGTDGGTAHYTWFMDNHIQDDWGSTTMHGNYIPGTTAGLGALTDWHINSFRSMDGLWEAAQNGVIYATTTSNTVGFNSDEANPPTIGWDTFHFEGDIAEILIFNSFLTDEEAEKVEGYLAHKWGLEGVLSADHPYKSAAPADGVTEPEATVVAKTPFNVAFDVTEIPNDGETAATLISTLPSGTQVTLKRNPGAGLMADQTMTYSGGAFTLKSNLKGDHVLVFEKMHYKTEEVTIHVI